MKRNKTLSLTAALVLLCLGSFAQASITIPTVFVGNAGNANDTTGYGAVAYNYNIGKYDVTAGQYTAFLNAVAATDTYSLYNPNMAYSNTNTSYYGCGITQNGSSGSYTYSVADPNLPVVYVSYWDSCRFANWLGNGQPTGAEANGTTETGAYTLNGYNGTDGRTITRNAGYTWAVTSEDEWYKAAYYKGGGTNAGYWTYATQSNTVPTATSPTGAANSANYYDEDSYPSGPGYTTDVGAYTGSGSAYGTFDQNGNVYDWNEAIPYISGSNAYRGLRGGSFFSYYATYLRSSDRGYVTDPNDGYDYIGFRVSQVPEPSSIIALLGGLTGLIGLRRRKA